METRVSPWNRTGCPCTCRNDSSCHSSAFSRCQKPDTDENSFFRLQTDAWGTVSWNSVIQKFSTCVHVVTELNWLKHYKQWRRNDFNSGGGAEHTSGAKRRKTFCHAPPLFSVLQLQLVVFDERFRDGQYSLVSFSFAVFFYSRWPRAQSFVKVEWEGTCPVASEWAGAGDYNYTKKRIQRKTSGDTKQSQPNRHAVATVRSF